MQRLSAPTLIYSLLAHLVLFAFAVRLAPSLSLMTPNDSFSGAGGFSTTRWIDVAVGNSVRDFRAERVPFRPARAKLHEHSNPPAPALLPSKSAEPSAPRDSAAGIVAGEGTATPTYLASLRARIAVSLARARRQAALRGRAVDAVGHLRVALTITRDGSLGSAHIDESSGSSELDELAIEAVKRAGPFAPFGAEITAPSVTLLLPIDFRPS
jgi:protein TonB